MAEVTVSQSRYNSPSGTVIHYGYVFPREDNGLVWYAESEVGPLVVTAKASTLPEALALLGEALHGALHALVDRP